MLPHQAPNTTRRGFTPARTVSSIAIILVLIAAALSSATPTRAAFTFPLTETFMTASAPGWVLGGSPSPAILTSGRGDPSGSGWLRLTNANTSQAGFAYYNEPIPTGRGLVITFDYAAWGGTAADGLTFFLFDGATPTFNVGASGGSLGYAQKTGVPGLSNGYLGLGLDEFGNYSNPNEGRSGGPGFIPQAVAVRGPGSGTTGYNYLAGTPDLTKAPWNLPRLDCPRNVGSCGSGSARPAGSVYYRQVQITVTPVGSAYQVTVAMKFSASGAWTPLFGPFTMPTAAPGTLKMGFAASTGGSTNYHEIRNLTVTQQVADLTATKAVQNATTGGGSAAPGDQLLYTVVLKNNTAAAISGVRFTDPIPANTAYVPNSAVVPPGSTLNAASPTLDVSGITIPAYGQAAVTFKVQLAAALPTGVTQISNQGVYTYGPGPTTAQTDGDAVAPGSQPTLISVTAGPNFDTSTKTVTYDDRDHSGAVSPGDVLTYHIVLPNTGNQNSPAIAFSDVIPANTTYVTNSAVASRGAVTYSAAARTLSWTVSVDAGTQATLDFQVTVNSGVPLRTLISNQGALAYGSPLVQVLTDADLAAPGKQPTQLLVGGVASLSAVKTASVVSAPLRPGGVVQYTITLTNPSSYAVSGAVFADTLPAHTAYVNGSLSATTGSASYAGSAIQVTGINLAPGATATIAFRVRLDDPLPNGVTQISNQGVASWDANQSGANDASTQTDGDPAAAGQQPTVTHLPATDLTLTKMVDNANPAEGESIVYTVVVTNQGPNAADDVTVTDALPAGLSYRSSVASQGSYTDPTWDVGALPVGGAATLTIAADVAVGQGGGAITNTVAVSSSLYDPYPSNNSASAALTAKVTALTGVVTDQDTGAPLAGVTVQAGESCTAVTGADGVYTVTSGVDGCLLPASTTALDVTAAPPGYLLTSGTHDIIAGTVNEHDFALLRPSLSGVVSDLGAGVPLAGATVTLVQGEVTCTTTTGEGGVYTFSAGTGSPACNFVPGAATVTAAYPSYENASANPVILSTGPTTQDLALGTVDLLITKSDDRPSANPGDLVEYQIVVTNNGSISATDVVLTDRMSPYLTYVSDDSGITPSNPSAGVYQWALGDLEPYNTFYITVSARVAASLPDGANRLSNYARVDNTSAERDKTNNEVSDINTVVAHPDLALQKTFTSPSPAVSGSTVLYQLNGGNIGHAAATGVQIVDTLDVLTTYAAGSAALSVNGASVSVSLVYDDGTKQLTFDLPDLAPADSFELTYAASVGTLPSPSESLYNQATINAEQADLDPDSNTASVYVPTINAADVAVTKSATPAAGVTPGQQIVYTLAYANNGSDTALDVTLTDAIPAHTRLVAGSITGGGSQDGGNIIWDLGDLAGRSSGTVSFTVQVDSALPAGVIAIDNTASIATPTDDASPLNNSASVSTPATAQPDLVIGKDDGQVEVLAGSQVIYYIQYGNHGDQTASGVTVVDTLLSGLHIDPDYLTGGIYYGANPPAEYDAASNTLTWTIGELPVDGQHYVPVSLLVDDDAQPGTVAANQARILEDETNGADPNPADNTATDSNRVVAPEIVLEKSASAPAYVGETLTYTIQGHNPNNVLATNVVVTDEVPAGVNYVAGSASNGGVYNGGTRTITWTVGDVAPGDAFTLTFAGIPTPAAGGAAQTQPTLTTEPGGGSVTVTSSTSALDLPWCDAPECAAYRGRYQGEDGRPPEGWKDNPRLTGFDDAGWTQPVAASDAESFYWTDASHLSAEWTAVHTAGELIGNFTFFRQSFCTPLNATGLSANLELAGDDVNDIYLNDVYLGQKVGAGAALAFDGSWGVQPGLNLLAVQLLNNRHGGHAALGGEDHSGLLFNLNAAYTGLRPFVSAPTMVMDGQPVTFSADETALAGPDHYTYRYDFGDGQQSGYLDSAEQAHTYAAPGVYTATITARGAQGCTGSDQVTITVLPDGHNLLANTAQAAYEDANGHAYTAQAGAGTDLGLAADLTIIKSVTSGGEIPGSPVTYQLLVSSAGPNDAIGALVTDTIPAVVTDVTWTCSATGGGSCAHASGSGSTLSELVNLPIGSTATFTLQGMVDADARGPLENTAAVAPPDGVTDLNPDDNHSTVSTTLAPDVVLEITKTGSPNPGLTPGGDVTYVIEVRNTGSSNAAAVRVTDTLPAELGDAAWTCAASSGSTCSGSGSGSIDDSAVLLAGGRLTYTLHAVVDTATPYETEIVNTAAAAFENTTVSASDTITLVDPTELTVSKDALDTNFDPSRLQPFIDTDLNGGISPGDILLYQVEIFNMGGDAYQLAYTDPLAAHTTLVAGSVSCTAACTIEQGSASGDTAVMVTLPVLPAESRIAILYMAEVDADLPFDWVSLPNQGRLTSANAPAVASDDLQTLESYDPTAVLLAKGSIEGMAWRDDDRDGVRDPGEPPLANIPVALQYKGGDGVWGSADDQVVYALTGDDGAYGFYDLLAGGPGLYRLGFTPPPGFAIGPAGADNKANPATGLTAPQTVLTNDTVPDVSAGIVSLADYGNLPASFGNTAWAANGARHQVIPGGLHLGGSVLTENDGAPSAPIDNDGVTRRNQADWNPGDRTELYVTASGPGRLYAWLDWNGDGDFKDAGEAVNLGQVQAGTQQVSLTVGAAYVNDRPLYARFRLYPADYNQEFVDFGLVYDGEVEDYYWTFSPTAVSLTAFQAVRQLDGARLEWQTAQEIDLAGFHLYRSLLPNGPFVRITPALIPARAAGALSGASYTWLDRTARPTAEYAYKLQAVNTDNTVQWFGPFWLLITPQTLPVHVYLPVIR